MVWKVETFGEKTITKGVGHKENVSMKCCVARKQGEKEKEKEKKKEREREREREEGWMEH